MRKDFRHKEKIKRLLWCDRHCCVCEKECGVNIEIAHIEQNDNYDIDNAIPVCYECHAMISAYNTRHPRGTKFKAEEIKARREQIYEKYTRQYVAPIEYVISQEGKDLAEVGFSVVNLSDYLAAILRITVRGLLNGRRVPLNLKGDLYNGRKVWNLNPRRIVKGHFTIRNKRLTKPKAQDRFEIRTSIIQTDPLEREHRLLEDGYVYTSSTNSWYYEPQLVAAPNGVGGRGATMRSGGRRSRIPADLIIGRVVSLPD